MAFLFASLFGHCICNGEAMKNDMNGLVLQEWPSFLSLEATTSLAGHRKETFFFAIKNSLDEEKEM